MPEPDDIIERVVETLKEPVRIDPSFDARVMSQIVELPVPGTSTIGLRSLYQWLRRRRTIRLSPLAGLAMAAGMVALVLTGDMAFRSGASPSPEQITGGLQQITVQFVLVAPAAGSVAVVGDFNDWDLRATPLVRSDGDGVWAVTVPLTPGRYRYSFLVDGTTWLRDPRAARTVEDEFGRTNSVLTIGGA